VQDAGLLESADGARLRARSGLAARFGDHARDEKAPTAVVAADRQGTPSSIAPGKTIASQ